LQQHADDTEDRGGETDALRRHTETTAEHEGQTPW
jgi:hypothetical protein